MNTADLTSLTNPAPLKPMRFQLFADLPVRAKLLLAFLITAVSASMIAFFSARTTSAHLTETVGAQPQECSHTERAGGGQHNRAPGRRA